MKVKEPDHAEIADDVKRYFDKGDHETAAVGVENEAFLKAVRDGAREWLDQALSTVAKEIREGVFNKNKLEAALAGKLETA